MVERPKTKGVNARRYDTVVKDDSKGKMRCDAANGVGEENENE